jgi:hypothetical protein
MYLGLLDLDPDLLVRGMDLDPSITKQKQYRYSKKNLLRIRIHTQNVMDPQNWKFTDSKD